MALSTPLENNRFEKAYQRLRSNKFKAIVATFVLLFVVENTLAWLYVSKRSSANQPFIDLLERYIVLRPFRVFFPEQYTIPTELWPIFKGETSQPDGLRALYSSDGLLGHRLAPSTVVTDHNWTWYGTNAQGLIMTDSNNYYLEYPIPKPDGVYRIIVLGGSTVEGDGATGSTTSLPAKLQDILRSRYIAAARPQTRIEVINGGVGGYFSTQELLLYISDLRHFQPDLVISYNGWNDLKLHNDALQIHGLIAPQLWHTETDPNNIILNNYYEFWPTFGRAMEIVAQRIIESLQGLALVHIPGREFTQQINKILQTAKANTPQARPNLPFSPRSVERYVDNLELLILRNRADNVATAWFLQPLVGLGNKPLAAGRELSFFESRPNRVERRKNFYRLAEKAQQEIIQKYSKSATICGASLVNVFDGHAEVIYEDSGHLYDNGNVMVAKRIASELAACGIIREAPNAKD